MIKQQLTTMGLQQKLERFEVIDENYFSIEVIGFNEEQKEQIREAANKNDVGFYHSELTEWRTHERIILDSNYEADINNMFDLLEEFPVEENWDDIERSVDGHIVDHRYEVKIVNN